MSIINAISRDDENEIPEFKSDFEAGAWFKNQYGDRFKYVAIDSMGEEPCSFYHLILNKDVYFSDRKELDETGRIDDLEAHLQSFQPIEIFSNGSVHIVH